MTRRSLAGHLHTFFIVSAILSGGAFAGGTIAYAQAPTEKSVDAQIFQSAIGPRGFLTLDSAQVPAHKLFGIGLVMNYQNRPFSITATDDTGMSLGEVDVIKNQLAAELTGAIGLFDRFQLGLALPMTLLMEGQAFDPVGGPSGSTFKSNGKFGDIRVEGKGLISSWKPSEESTDEVLFSVVGGLTLPTGKDSTFQGDKTFTGRIRGVVEYRTTDLRAGAMFGVLLRDPSTLFKAEVGQQMMYAVGTEYSLHKQVSLLAELFGRHGFNSYLDTSPTEIDVAMRVYVTSMLSITAGGGAGVVKGIGAPRFRGFLGVQWSPDFRDRDADGVPDIDDRCPDVPEDRDGFKDGDGCPESDNDGDGLVDAQDKCPTDAEDLDQNQDEDGCPELDNDNDGVPDLNDPCPNAAEDGHGKRPKDGCPSSAEDGDGDGVADAKDQCPDEPEDRDGFKDYDGCPEPDNDDDGIPDNFDSCPSAAEDADGFDDGDGCPDPDNDKDGFEDAKDKCPDKPETLNGNKDDDGCPDPGAEIVKLGEGKIEVRERITFKDAGGRSSLTPTGATITNLVALLLKGHPEITSVRVDVFADGLSKDATTARGEVIKAAMVAAGVDAARIKVNGMGGGGSRVDFIVEEVAEAKKPAPPAANP